MSQHVFPMTGTDSVLTKNSEKVCDIPLLLLERRPVITVDARGCGKLSFSENTSASASTLSELELPNYHDIESGPSRTPLMHRAATAVASDVPATGPELKFKGKERDSDVTPNTSMAIDQPQLDIFKPTWTGRIQSNSDALLVIEAARRGKLPRITRPLAPSEREIIAPGIVLVFSESESGIRDWNDHLLWIQGGVQGNFRQCYQLDDLDKRVGMTKRIYSHTTDGDTYHLIAYDPNIASGAVLLPRASEDRSLASLTFIETTTSESDTEDTSESRHNGTAENIAPPTARRPARPPANNACKSCRRLHFRCDWNEQTSCERCLAMGIECLQPNSNPRKKPKRPKTTTPESSTAPDSSSGNPTAAEEAFQPYPWGVGSGSK
ncbi:Gti1/Pac2 family-domain-containing protein [Amylocystis lapponica]|nr:Gti1/Pac2 family-domain-containing protein [Amylocystis lapponica]